ncbi:MAG: EVE domain-containing protein [Acidobacteria bacterium]|nr:MAG: EVE domain-containing protein [Acidobacteriota bacterium]
MATKYWLMKVEPEVYTIDDLKRDGKTNWEGVRNYKARNYMRDEMQVGDEVLFYASNADPSGVTGLAKIVRAGYPEKDPTWSQVDIAFVKSFGGTVSLETLKHTKGLEKMGVIRKGNRLSIQPVAKSEFEIVKKLGATSQTA